MNRKHNRHQLIHRQIQEENKLSPHHLQQANKKKFRPSNRTPKVVVYTKDIPSDFKNITARAMKKVVEHLHEIKGFAPHIITAHQR